MTQVSLIKKNEYYPSEKINKIVISASKKTKMSINFEKKTQSEI